MANNNDIRYCLEAYLDTIPFLPGVFNENLNDFPQDPLSHIATRFVPTSNRAVTTGDNPWRKKLGYFQVTVRVPINSGTGEQLEYADRIETSFSPGKFLSVTKSSLTLKMDFTNSLYSLDDKTLTVVIDYAEASGSYEESPYYCTPVSIGWHCHNL